MRNDNAILNLLYKGTKTIEEFQWDTLCTVPMLSLITQSDIDYMRKIILSPRYSGNNKLKMQKLDEIMNFRGFSRFAGGTNRLVYSHPSAPNAVFKVAIDAVGIKDNPAEMYNQQFLKPYCTKVFECSPCGTIASFEKVDRITTFEEYYSIADDYFYILSRIILGKYVMEDIGIDYFMNVGIRKGCYPVLLDFPYLFELDGRKLECINILDDGSICGGDIDYDYGFNKLICKKCGREYRARDLALPPKNSKILLKDNGGIKMKVKVMRGNRVIKETDTEVKRDFLSKNDPESRSRIKVTITRKPVEVPNSNCIHEKENVRVVDNKYSAPIDNNTNRRIINVNLNRNVNNIAKDILERSYCGNNANVQFVSNSTPVISNETHIEESTIVEEPEKELVENTIASVDESIVNADEVSYNNSSEEPIIEDNVIEEESEVVTEDEPIIENNVVEVEEESEVVTEDEPIIENNVIEEESEVVTEDNVVEDESEVVTEDETVAESSEEDEPIIEDNVVEEKSEVVTEDETVSESSEENKSMDDIRIEFIDEIPDAVDARRDTIYFIPESEEIDVESYKDIKDPKKIPIDKFKAFIVKDNKMIRIQYNEELDKFEKYDDVLDRRASKNVDEWLKENDIDPNDLTTAITFVDDESSKKDKSTTEENTVDDEVKEESETTDDDFEEDFGIEIKFVDEVPSINEVKENVYYFLPNDPDIDISVYNDVKDPRLISGELFAIWIAIKTDDGYELVRIQYNSDTDEYEEYGVVRNDYITNTDIKEETSVDNTEEKILASIKATSKKPDISNLVD